MFGLFTPSLPLLPQHASTSILYMTTIYGHDFIVFTLCMNIYFGIFPLYMDCGIHISGGFFCCFCAILYDLFCAILYDLFSQFVTACSKKENMENTSKTMGYLSTPSLYQMVSYDNNSVHSFDVLQFHNNCILVADDSKVLFLKHFHGYMKRFVLICDKFA